MSEHRATIRWVYAGGDFLAGRYSREHTWTHEQCDIANSVKTTIVVQK